MSLRTSSRRIGRTLGPAQIFKKRNDLINVQVPINANAFLLGTITLQETGTLYAITLDLLATSIAPNAGDVQRIVLWVRCVPEGTTLPDFTVNGVMDTVNGFSPATIFGVDELEQGVASYLHEKFRFRRKCDDNTLIQLIAQHTNTNGTGRVVEISGHFGAVIRVR